MNKSYAVFTWVITILVIVFSIYIFTKDPIEPGTPIVINTTDLKFDDVVNGVSFVYPKEFSLSSENVLIIPKSFQPNTNFSEAKFSVSKNNSKEALGGCYLLINGEESFGFVDINGVSFLKNTLGDAGAGNFYETTSYRTVYNESCFNISYLIHYTNIGAYSSEQGIKEFDKNLIIGILEKVVQSVRLL